MTSSIIAPVHVRSSYIKKPTVFTTSTVNIMASSPAGEGSASHPKRDRYLLIPDDILTDIDFDNLWEWFASALETNVDRQFIFVKLVNSVRKPYLTQSRPTLTAPSGNPFLSRTGTSYTPSECMIIDHTPGESQRHEDGDSVQKTSQIEELRLQLRDMATDLANLKKDNELRLLNTKPQSVLPSSAPRVAIMSAGFPDNFVEIYGKDVSSNKPNGSGKVQVQPHVRGHERLELECYSDGIVAFKSTRFQNVYLHASCNPRDLAPGDRKPGGGGVVNCQYISEGPGRCSIQEKFRIYPLGYRGRVAIEPLAFPGRYLSLDAEKRTVTLQGVRDRQESFYLVFLTP
ncbi:hypothetical protein BDZ91DRAFT_701470 [Kalaharituber pfeilii]|nr:hypothetical protein BDZ91DRAFT_701470 [Kalaharituber pfeilii]